MVRHENMSLNREKAIRQYKSFCNQYQKKEQSDKKVIITEERVNRQSIINCRA